MELSVLGSLQTRSGGQLIEPIWARPARRGEVLQVAGVGTVLGAPGLWVVHLPGVRDPLVIGEEMLDALFRAVTD